MNIEYIEHIKPRITDINYGGHLGHIELLGLLHEIRVQFLKKDGISEIDIQGSMLIMHQLSITYINQAFWDNELKVVMKMEIQGVKIIFTYSVFNLTLNNKTAVAETKMVLLDKEKQKLIKPNFIFELINKGNI